MDIKEIRLFREMIEKYVVDESTKNKLCLFVEMKFIFRNEKSSTTESKTN